MPNSPADNPAAIPVAINKYVSIKLTNPKVIMRHTAEAYACMARHPGTAVAILQQVWITQPMQAQASTCLYISVS